MTTQLSAPKRSRAATGRARSVAPDRSGERRKARLPSWRILSGWIYVLPALAVYAYVVIVPTIQSVWYSFWDWNGVGTATWVWFGNYVDFLSNPRLALALQHTVVFVFFYALLPICLGLVSAALVSRSGTRGNGFFRTVIFLPQVLTSVVIVVMWNELFSTSGLVNSFLKSIGAGALVQPWLGSFQWALPVLGLAGTWTTMGLCMLLFISGVGNIPSELYDAARVDGAGAIREFFSVTLPGLVPQVAVALTLTIIGALRVFDLVWLTTRGGPGDSTVTPSLLLYQTAFTEGAVGGGAAIGVCLAIVSIAIALVIVAFTDRRTS
jgi:raffinose/stachyose/melibiose transport system permease protein